jgi:putative transposase
VASDIQHCVRTLRLKVKREGYAWLDAAAIEVNQVWNYANATSYKAARPFAGTGKWLSAFDLDKLTAGATEYFERIGSKTIQRVNAEFATRRKQFKRAKLRWRVSKGSKRSLGWIPLKAAQLKRRGNSLRFSGKAFRVFERELLEGAKWKSGCFAQDALGDWWLCLPVEGEVLQSVAPKEAVGLDLGLKDTVATSDGDKPLRRSFQRGQYEPRDRSQRLSPEFPCASCKSIKMHDLVETTQVSGQYAQTTTTSDRDPDNKHHATSRPSETERRYQNQNGQNS